MIFKIKLFFYALVILTASVSIQAEEFTYEHDVTKQLDTWISRIFKVGADTFRKLLYRIVQKELDTYNSTISHEIQPFGSKLHFTKIKMNVSEFKSPQINWKFSSNKMSLFLKEFTVRIMADLRDSSYYYFAHFDSHIDLENVTFTLSIDGDTVFHEFKYDHDWIWYNENMIVYWTQVQDEVLESIKGELQKELQAVFPTLLHQNFKLNEHFSKSLKAIFHTYVDPKNKIIATHKDFFTSDQKYYYLIPKIPFFSFNLKNVAIRGLHNMEWLKINTGITVFTHTLMIRNVFGTLQLDFGTNQEKPVDLQFKIDYLSVSMDKKTVNADARCYSVNKTNTPLSYRQSALIMQRIESAIASSIFPNLVVRGTYEIDTPLEQIKITEKTDWNTIRKSFHEWIPFNENSIPPTAAPPAVAPLSGKM